MSRFNRNLPRLPVSQLPPGSLRFVQAPSGQVKISGVRCQHCWAWQPLKRRLIIAWHDLPAGHPSGQAEGRASGRDSDRCPGAGQLLELDVTAEALREQAQTDATLASRRATRAIPPGSERRRTPPPPLLRPQDPQGQAG